MGDSQDYFILRTQPKITRSNYLPKYNYQFHQDFNIWYSVYKEHINNMFNIFIDNANIDMLENTEIYKSFVYMIYDSSYKHIDL